MKAARIAAGECVGFLYTGWWAAKSDRAGAMRRHHPLKTKAAPEGAASFATGLPLRASAAPAGQSKTNKRGAEEGQGGGLRDAGGGCSPHHETFATGDGGRDPPGYRLLATLRIANRCTHIEATGACPSEGARERSEEKTCRICGQDRRYD